jgi:SAM-dependent methyltransferase
LKWNDLDNALRLELLAWHAPIWKPLFDWGFDDVGDLQGKRIFEVGCGDGGLACLLALCGARVYATDRSLARLHKAQQLTNRFDVAERVLLFNSDIYFPPVSPRTFDLVVTRSVLVLIDRPRVIPLLADLLTPTKGTALFVENMEGNPLLGLWRRLTNTKWGEYPYLTVPEVAGFEKYFASVQTRYQGPTVALAGISGCLEKPLAGTLQRFDSSLLRSRPELAKLASIVAIKCASARAEMQE